LLESGKDLLICGKDLPGNGKDLPESGKDSLKRGIERSKPLGTGENAVYSASAEIQEGLNEPFSSTNVLPIVQMYYWPK